MKSDEEPPIIDGNFKVEGERDFIPRWRWWLGDFVGRWLPPLIGFAIALGMLWLMRQCSILLTPT